MNVYEAIVQGKVHPDQLPTVPEGVFLETLDNGLTVVLKPEPGTEVLTAMLWCFSGSVDEGPWLGAGLSHLLEHMLFKGTDRRPPGQIDKEIEALGGSMNAHTSYDHTAYYIDVPSAGCETAIDILYDIACHAALPEEELKKEMDVIRREMDMERDEPGSYSSRRLYEVLYTVDPHRVPIIGYRPIFDRLTREDILRFYRRTYVPNNLGFFLVGGFDLDQARQWIRQRWESVPPGSMEPWALVQEPPLLAPRSIEEEGPFEMAWIHYAWRIPPVHHPDIPALQLAAALLGAGRSSRLFRELRLRRGLVLGVQAWVSEGADESLFRILLVAPVERMEEAEQVLQEELNRLAQTPPEPAELQKCITLFLSSCLRSQESTSSKASTLAADWAFASDLSFTARTLGRTLRTPPEALSRVIQTHLSWHRRVRYALLPKGASRRRFRPVPIPEQEPGELVRPCGTVRLLKRQDRRIPLVFFGAHWLGGTLFEPVEKNGITRLMAQLWTRGTERLSAEQIAEKVEQVGGSIEAAAHRNTLSLTASALATHWEEALDLLLEVLFHPSFPEEALLQEKHLQIQAIQAQKDDLVQWGFRVGLEHLFGKQAYGLPALGTEQTVASLTREDLLALHRERTDPGRAVFWVSGAVDLDQVEERLRERLAPYLRPESLPLTPPGSHSPNGQGRLVFEPVEKAQTLLLILFPGTTATSEDRHALSILNSACQGMGSRIFQRIREKHGLSYYAGMTQQRGIVPGYLAFYLGTSPENLTKAFTELKDELLHLAQEGLTEEQLRLAQKKILGHQKLNFQSQQMLATEMTLYELYGLGYRAVFTEMERLQAVTVEEVREVAAKYLRLERALAIVVGPESVRSQLDQLKLID